MFRIFIVFLLLLVSSVGRASTIDDRLLDAAKTGDVSAIRKLVREGANVNSVGKHGVSAPRRHMRDEGTGPSEPVCRDRF